MIAFYLSSILFIWMQLYYISNISKLDVRFMDKDINKLSKLDLVYYATRLLYWFWIVLGIIIGVQATWFLLFIGVFKMISYHINSKFYKICNLIFIPMLLMIIIFIFSTFIF